MLEYLILAELTVITSVVTAGVIVGLVAIKKIRGAVGPVVGLVNAFSGGRGR